MNRTYGDLWECGPYGCSVSFFFLGNLCSVSFALSVIKQFFVPLFWVESAKMLEPTSRISLSALPWVEQGSNYWGQPPLIHAIQVASVGTLCFAVAGTLLLWGEKK